MRVKGHARRAIRVHPFRIFRSTLRFLRRAWVVLCWLPQKIVHFRGVLSVKNVDRDAGLPFAKGVTGRSRCSFFG